MTPGEPAAVRGGLGELGGGVCARVARRDQRDKGVAYVRGLLLDGRRKSMQPMAGRLGVDQGLQQLFSSSTWAVEPVNTYSHLWPTAEDRTRGAAEDLFADSCGLRADSDSSASL